MTIIMLVSVFGIVFGVVVWIKSFNYPKTVDKFRGKIMTKAVQIALVKVMVRGRFKVQMFQEICGHDLDFAAQVLAAIVKGIDVIDVDALRQIAMDLGASFSPTELQEIMSHFGTSAPEIDMNLQLAWVIERRARKEELVKWVNTNAVWLFNGVIPEEHVIHSLVPMLMAARN